MKLCQVKCINCSLIRSSTNTYKYCFYSKSWQKVTIDDNWNRLEQIGCASASTANVVELLVEATSKLNSNHWPFKSKWLIIDFIEGSEFIALILADIGPNQDHKMVGEVINWREDLE